MNQWDKGFFDLELADYANFEDFVLHWLTPDNIVKHHHFKPPHHYFIDRYNKMTVGYIGCLENIDEDFAYIANRLGKTCTLEKQNVIKRDTYQSFYTDLTRKKVSEIYQKDIDLFKYQFDGPTELVRKLHI